MIIIILSELVVADLYECTVFHAHTAKLRVVIINDGGTKKDKQV